MRLTFGSIAAYLIAVMSAWLQPAIIDALRHGPGFSAAAAGAVSGVEVAIVGLVSILFGTRMERSGITPRRVAVLGCGLVVITNALSVFTVQLAVLTVARLVAGVGQGMVYSIATKNLATRVPRQRIGYVVAAYTLGEGLIVFLAPWVSVPFGPGGIFALMGGVTLMLIPVVALLPNERLAKELDPKMGSSTAEDWYRSAIGWCLLAGTALWATNAGMLWAFSFDFGSAAGLSLRQVGAIASACIVASALGSAVSSTVCKWVPRATALIGAISIQSGAMILVVLLPGSMAYVVGLMTFSFTAYACYPLLLGAATGIDPKGRLAVVIASTFYLGAFAGPTLGGVLLAWWGTRNVVALVVAICFLPIASMLLLAEGRIRAQAKGAA